MKGGIKEGWITVRINKRDAKRLLRIAFEEELSASTWARRVITAALYDKEIGHMLAQYKRQQLMDKDVVDRG